LFDANLKVLSYAQESEIISSEGLKACHVVEVVSYKPEHKDIPPVLATRA